MGYSVDLRLAAVRRYLESGDAYAETGKIFGVDASSVQRWVRQHKETGDLSDKPLERGFKKIDPAKLRTYVKDHPAATQQEIADEFGCSNQTVGKALSVRTLRVKKRAATRNRKRRK
jgi:transposase-like protein